MKPLVAAVALACTAYNSAHAVTANQMPGAGLITAVSTGATVNGLTTGGALINLVSSPTAAQISLGGVSAPRAVIQWGGAGTGALGEKLNPPGFNVGTGASLNFETAGGFGIGAVLNVDASGSISQILGMVRGDTIAGGSNGYTTIFIANANGVTVGPSARIIAPWGVGLLGADMTGGTAKYEFTRQNGAGVSFVDVTTGQSDVIVGGVINGDAISNTPAKFILLVGGNVTNTGNLFGAQVGVSAGLRAAPTTDTVNGVAKTTVNRIWRLDSTFPYGTPGAINGNLGTCNGCIEVALATASFVNTGSISASGTNVAPLGNPTSYIGISAASSIRSGTLGDTSQLVGLFSDGGIVTNTFSATGKTELYNVVEAYTIGNTLPFLNINQSTKAAGDVTINALTAGSNPSSITTTGAVSIYGGNVVIDSTINHKLNSAGGKQGDVDLTIVGSKSVTITKDIGAGQDVVICAAAVGCVAGAGGPITISGNVLTDTNSGGIGGIYIVNYGTQSGNTTTISGNLATAKTSVDGIYVVNYGLSNSKVVISGTMTTWHDADIGIFSNGSFDFSGNIMASGNAGITAMGLSTNLLRGPITADTVGDGNGGIAIAAPLSATKLYPAAVLTAPGVSLGYDWFGAGWIGVGSFVGTDATGAPYATAAAKPVAQIVTDNLVLAARGNFNAPIAGNTNWLLNQMQVASLTPSIPMALSLSAVGAAFQAINVGITGEAFVDSGLTVTPFFNIPLSTGVLGGGGLIGNGGSQLIINASSNLTIVGNSGAQFGAGTPGGPGFNTGVFYEFPGGSVFKSGGTLTQLAPVYNAWTTVAQPFQGIFFEAPIINALAYTATNGNSWTNYSVLPLTGVPVVYQINQNPPTGLALGFGFLPNPLAPHLNTYSKLLTGTPVNTCPIGFTC